MKKLSIMVLCFCLFVSFHACAAEMIDFENASIEELEMFLSLMDNAQAAHEAKKNNRTAEEMCEIAIAEMKKQWAKDKFFMEETTRYFQVLHTRVIYLDSSYENAACIKENENNPEKLLEKCKNNFSNENGSPMIAFVECVLLTDIYDTAPYYMNSPLNNCVAFYQDGTVEVFGRSPIEILRSTAYITNYDGIIREITDMGSQYNEICYLK